MPLLLLHRLALPPSTGYPPRIPPISLFIPPPRIPCFLLPRDITLNPANINLLSWDIVLHPWIITLHPSDVTLLSWDITLLLSDNVGEKNDTKCL